MEPTQTPNKFKAVVAVFVGLAILVGVYKAYTSYFSYTTVTTDDESQPAKPESYGLDVVKTPTFPPLAGNLSYTSPAPLSPQTDELTFSRQIELETNLDNLVTFVPGRDYHPLTNDTGLLIASPGSTHDSISFQPHHYDRKTETLTPVAHVGGNWVQELQVAADNNHYAYTYTATPNPSPNVRSVSDWNIALHEIGGSEPVIIEQATHPRFMNGGKDLLYAQFDGLYRYNIASGETSLVFSDYLPLDYNDGLAVSPDSKTVILTVPFVRERTLVSVLRLNEAGMLEEIGAIASDDTKRRSPVFSPNGEYYAVVAANETRSDGSFNMPEIEQKIEIRQVENATPVEVVTLPANGNATVMLDGWTH